MITFNKVKFKSNSILQIWFISWMLHLLILWFDFNVNSSTYHFTPRTGHPEHGTTGKSIHPTNLQAW